MVRAEGAGSGEEQRGRGRWRAAARGQERVGENRSRESLLGEGASRAGVWLRVGALGSFVMKLGLD